MADDAETVMREIEKDGVEVATRAFAQACGNVESVAKDLCPVGHYGRARGNAAVQHDEAFHHPGLYTGAAGPQFAARYFERAVEIVFGSGADPLNDPGGQLGGTLPATFQELLEEEQKG